MTSGLAAYLSLGSNLGDRRDNLQQALELMEEAGIAIRRRSSVYESAPQNYLDQPWFLNMAVEVETSLPPAELLSLLQSIERRLGRDRNLSVRFGPRSIDLDILLYGSLIVDTPGLVLPHPRMWERRFVLEPLSEIAPELVDPVSGRPLQEFLTLVADQPIRPV